MSTAKWDTRLEVALSSDAALRVVQAKDLFRLAQSIDAAVSPRTVERWTLDAVCARRLVRVRRGLYLNHLTRPLVQPAEAAAWLRQHSVVSLQTVLGDSGVWNNYTNLVTCVVPLSPDTPPPSLGRVPTQISTYVFHGIPVAVLVAGAERDRLDLQQSIGYVRASAEAALLHWIYLGRSPRSTLSLPPYEMDINELDRKKLHRLANAQGLLKALQEWLGGQPARRAPRPSHRMAKTRSSA